MPVSWFSEVDLEQSPPPARRIFSGVCQLLDQLQPSDLDVARQTVGLKNGETWIRLVHVDDDAADLDITVGVHTTHIYGLYGHDEDYATGAGGESRWIADTIETLTSLLRGRYRIEHLRWNGRAYRTNVTDLVGDARSLTAFDSPLGMLPLPRRLLTSASREIDYRCQGD